MDFELSTDDAAFRNELRGWLSTQRALIQEINQFSATASRQDAFRKQREWDRALYDAGWAAVAWPREYGGRGATLIQQALFIEECDRASTPERPSRLGLGLLGPTLMAFGTPAQKERHLAKILAAEEIWCQGFSEPGAGSDLASLRTRAEDRGDHWLVNGQKVWTSLGAHADWIFALVRTDPAAAPKHRGITFLLIDMKTPGIEVRPIRQINGSPAFTETFFTDVKVPKGNVVDTVNNGWKVAMATLGFERGSALGAPSQFHRIWRQVVGMSRTETRHGAPASQDADVRRRVAQAYIETRVFELNSQRVLSKLSKGQDPGPLGSMSKLYWSEMNARLFELGSDIMGPKAELTVDGPDFPDAAHWFYDYWFSRGKMIYAGTTEIQKNIIAQRVLGLPRE
ncbi:MAG: acyl-CoA dehydrogenase family protein [Candidatus Dormibacteria bacterium]